MKRVKKDFNFTRTNTVFFLYKSPFAGGPRAASEERLGRARTEAAKSSSASKARNPSGFAARLLGNTIADPDSMEDSEDESGNLELWRLLPQLKELPEALLRKLPVSAMFQLNAALAKEKKTSEKLGINSRLAKNSKKSARNPTAVDRGQDNRKDILHPARFLGGASCNLTELWDAARRIIGEEGILPLGNYDLDTIGCGGCVTPKGWAELHNPSSQDLKLKWFHLPNVAVGNNSSKKSDGDDSNESGKEIADLDSFKMALNTAREAMASALPWNRSISAITGLMINTNYLQEDLMGNSRRAAILTEFVDYAFSRNALNWENGQPFLSTDELTHVWANWKCKRGISAEQPKKHKKEKEGRETDGKKKALSGICRYFNTKSCKNQAAQECKTPMGKTMRHVCNKYLAGGKVCQKDHSRPDHI